MTTPADPKSDLATIEAVRSFNRFYTNQLGLIGRAFLDSPYSLTEARILFELNARPAPVARQIAEDLQLDTAYLSRTLKAFREKGLLTTQPDPADKRSQTIALTPKGRAEAADLADRSRRQVAQQLLGLSADQRQTMESAMATLATLLAPSEAVTPVYAIRAHQPGDIGWVIHRQMRLYAAEYGWNSGYEALIARITSDFLAAFNPGREYCWIAEKDGTIAGSVFLVDGGDNVAKLRLLYVEPFARGLGIGKALVRACIGFAREAGYTSLTLWTNDILVTARRLYEAEGFVLVAEEPHHSFGMDLNGQTWQRDL
ncbi:bifunctional helix-turn-helix transcriptional regulator/GNAT family N-acetyltransferase [Pararhizobium antarcticum]|uniref:MarR family transcriptional regulator n=1 Tax=Pararhizobium antarcticum TaxID=1798805 RepID=A0A657LRE2_9HYPH|nr:helix-turn-helix domain-containing GNAT family N-acetyltransferase [Pararhizobium antarcticum]OJF92033.1 MarR family transcriptional regulator [Rhizobium sp. 58]OJF96070.1 MarR family transcriptional regulator [Pararhizobium antarcticum]